ncbi:PAS domain-containing protein [Halorubellus sp. PRR65]|uniref:PAS domain-containing protein n=1 Tax=Halorubellus sp. PRR65 TaxID=3098148 RepID=UPI002B2578C0|nr:PAS domain-containing protein [Halorubellus sp. PRR65]
MSEHDPGTTASDSDRDPRQRDLFEVSRDAILVHDVDDGRVVDANDAAERLLGYDSEALVGLSIEALGSGVETVDGTGSTLSGADARDAIWEALETGETRFQWQVERADGDRRWVDVSMARAQLREEERLLSFLRDVTGQREQTDALHESRAALRDLHENQMGDGSTESKIAAMLETGCRFLDMEYAYLTAIEDDVQTVTQSLGNHETLRAGATAPLAETYCQLTYGEDATDGLCTVRDAGEVMADTEAYERFGMERYVGKQVVVDGEVHGTVCFAGSSPRTRPFSQAERMFVDVVAGWIGTELERGRQRTELVERQRRANALFNAPSSLIGVVEPDGTLIEANETALDLADVDADDVRGEPFWETPWWAYDAASRAKLRDAIERAAGGETVDFDATHLTPDGEELTAAVTARPVVTDGEVETVVVHGIDVTERERRERELRRNQQRLQAVLDNVPLVLFAVDADGTFTLSKGNALGRLGMAEDEVVGEDAFELYDGNETVVDGLVRALAGESVSFETEFGSAFFRTWARPLYEDGAVTGAIGVSVDVTERHRQEKRLETLSTATRRLMYPSTPDGVAAEAVSIAQDVLDEPMSAVWAYDDDRDALVPMAATDAALDTVDGESVADLTTFGPGTREYDVFRGNETTVVEDYRALDDGGSGEGALGTVAFAPLGSHGLLTIGRPDVTAYSDVEVNLLAVLRNNTIAALDRADREQALERYQRELERSNESLQQFAYVASHDLQEPLRMVSSYVDLLAREYGDAFDDEAEEYMEFAVDGADRMRSMIDALLTYSRVETHADDFESVDVDAVLDDVLQNLELRVDETGAEVTVDDLPTLRGDRDQLGQVFQNLVKNALEHAGEDAPTVVVECEEREDAYAFSVADDGVGIPDDRQDAVFEIFETDHRSASGDGGGIGLAVVERIVHRHGGDIWVTSEPGEGATFSFTIPKDAVTEPMHEVTP